MGYCILLRRCKIVGGCTPNIPDTPTATQYLYGHVAGADETPDVYIDGVGYVGAVLPDINTVYTDELKQTHPYGLVMFNDGMFLKTWNFIATQEAPFDFSASGDWTIHIDGERSVGWSIEADGTGQVLSDEWDSGYYFIGYTRLDTVKWANFDILNEDGSVHLAKSDPIPVYE